MGKPQLLNYTASCLPSAWSLMSLYYLFVPPTIKLPVESTLITSSNKATTYHGFCWRLVLLSPAQYWW